jgi:DNA-binding MarR family transcriptional regulator
MNELTDAVRRMQQDCFLLHTTMTARAIARHYEAAVRPLGLTSAQVSLLAALAVAPDLPVGRLADSLALERTTLTRNLKLLVARGLVEAREAPGRALHHHLTDAGRARLAAVVPLWERTQADMQARLGAASWPDLKQGLRDLRRPPRKTAPNQESAT